MKVLIYVIPVLLGCCTSLLSQQKYGEMSIGEFEELTTVVRRENQAVLIIVSEVPGLHFESSQQIIEVQKITENEWRLFLLPGRQIITIRSEGYLPLKTDVINFPVKRVFRLKVSQVRAVPGTLIIKTNPMGARFRINGAPIDAETPYQMDEVPPGQYYVQIALEGYHSEEKTLVVKSNEVTEWQIDLRQTGIRVQVDIEDGLEDVAIVIDDVFMATAPAYLYLEPGCHLLKLQKDGYSTLEKALQIELGMDNVYLVEKLDKAKKPLVSRWWFLVGSAAVVTTSAFLLFGTQTAQESELPIPPNFP